MIGITSKKYQAYSPKNASNPQQGNLKAIPQCKSQEKPPSAHVHSRLKFKWENKANKV